MKRFLLFFCIGLATLLPTHQCLAQSNSPSNALLKLSGPKLASVGQVIQVSILLSTQTSINVVQANLSYPKELLSVTNIGWGNSILRYWTQEPVADPSSGIISFAGGLPTPGFTGNNGRLLQISFKTRATGQANITFNSTKVLLNDGQGTETPSAGSAYTLQISPETPKQTTTPTTTPADTTPPNNLELFISHESDLFNGDWFAVFQAEDSSSGIDHYEIAEIPDNQAYPKEDDWVRAPSPYRLQIQENNTKIFLKAVDKNGNRAVISKTHAPRKVNPLATPNWRLLILLSILAILAVVLPIFVYHRKKS